MNPNKPTKAWERTYNAAITGLAVQNPQKSSDAIVQEAKVIADKSPHVQFAEKNRSVRADFQQQRRQEYKSPR